MPVTDPIKNPFPTPGRRSRIMQVFAGMLAVALWAYYVMIQEVVAPLNPDEMYFSHVLWMMYQGKALYADFFAQHLPAYFELVVMLNRHEPGADLSFVYPLRLLGLLLVLAYVAITWRLCTVLEVQGLVPKTTHAVLAVLPVVLFFVAFARMVEIRSDSIALILINGSWLSLILAEHERSRNSSATAWVLASGLLAAAALGFSARAAVLLPLLLVMIIYLNVSARDWRTVRAGVALLAVLALGALLVFLLWQAEITRIVRMSFFMASNTVGFPFVNRFADLQVTGLVLAYLAASAGALLAIFKTRIGDRRIQLVILVAIADQLFLLLIDPAPYGYAYGYALVPAAAGLCSLWASIVMLMNGRLRLPFLAPFALVALGAFVALAGYSLAYPKLKENKPRPAFLKLQSDPEIPQHHLTNASETELTDLLVRGGTQHNLANQLAIRTALCRRFEGEVLAIGPLHPICLPDAAYYWGESYWAPLVAGAIRLNRSSAGLHRPDFEAVLRRSTPMLLLWGEVGPNGRVERPLLPWVSAAMHPCFEQREGYAICSAAISKPDTKPAP